MTQPYLDYNLKKIDYIEGIQVKLVYFLTKISYT